MSDGKLRKIDLKDVRFVIQHESLPPELLARIKAIWELLKDGCYEPSFEKFEAGFMYDSNPESEVKVWEWIAAAYHEIMSLARHVGAEESREARVELQGLLINITTGGMECQASVAAVSRLSKSLEAGDVGALVDLVPEEETPEGGEDDDEN